MRAAFLLFLRANCSRESFVPWDLFQARCSIGRDRRMSSAILRSFFQQGTFYRSSRFSACAILDTPAVHPVRMAHRGINWRAYAALRRLPQKPRFRCGSQLIHDELRPHLRRRIRPNPSFQVRPRYALPLPGPSHRSSSEAKLWVSSVRRSDVFLDFPRQDDQVVGAAVAVDRPIVQ